jgi:hypothetical protein
MSASPLEQIAPELTLASAKQLTAAAAPATRTRFRPYLYLLTAFWVYVLISNLMYANNMQASLTQMKVEHVFAASDARTLQHLMLYPVFIFCMWRALRSGWQPLRRKLPVQLAFALGFSILASPALMLGEKLSYAWWGFPAEADHGMKDMSGWGSFLASELPTWIASATNFLVTYCFGLALVTAFATYQRLRDAQLRSAALERALTQSHLQALRMQLSPHTLFNLLHTIRGQITWDPPAAQTMVVQLGDLLRRLLTAGEREFSRLSDEMQFVTLYLELQQKRFADRLTITVPQRGSLPPAWVPSLILQPLVENAVVHGLAGHDAAVSIAVEVHAQGETLTLRVLNTIAPGKAVGGNGIGLANVRERLEVQFGERARFTSAPAADGLWLAEIVMPLLRDGPGLGRPEGGGAP